MKNKNSLRGENKMKKIKFKRKENKYAKVYE